MSFLASRLGLVPSVFSRELAPSSSSRSLSSAASSDVVVKAPILALYRTLLRSAGRFSDYNVRSYSRRRIVEEFKKHQRDSHEKAKEAFSFGEKQLELINRQVLIRSLYADRTLASVMTAARRPPAAA